MSQALYDQIGVGYSQYRKPDARIAARIERALGQSRGVLNVGAGAGSYEPRNRLVIAVEPSAEMIRQRPPLAAQAVQAEAGGLPFKDRSFDTSLAILSVHHWSNPERGLDEMRRVARERVVIFTWDPEHQGFWLVQDYMKEIAQFDRLAFPSLSEIERAIGPTDVETVAIPADCSDGFLGAYWRRPAAYLDPGVRAAISTFSKFDGTAELARLEADLQNGTWNDRYGDIVGRQELDIGYRLVVTRCV
jgi:SAM-dependent methyltransferase